MRTHDFRQAALSFAETDEHPHFNRAAFRVRKHIFASLLEAQHLAMVQLTPAEQSVYCDFDPVSFYPATGAWGKQGCTMVKLQQVKPAVVKEALAAAYAHIAGKYPPKTRKS